MSEWTCSACGHRNPDKTSGTTQRKTRCDECFEDRPAKPEKKRSDKLQAGDRVLGYELDADLKPVRRYVGEHPLLRKR